MSVRVVPYGEGSFEADVRLKLPNGQPYRERKVLKGVSKSVAKRWSEERERHLLQHGLPESPKEVPTLEQFASRFIDGHAKANRQKPSGIAAKEGIIRVHLIPLLGSKRLDAIGNEDVQIVKSRLTNRSPKTVNNVLGVLSVLLRKAVEWEVIERIPCVIRLLKTLKPAVRFYDFEEYGRLITTAETLGSSTHVIVLLGGEAGLRRGEIAALEWADVDLDKRQICVQRSDWKGQVSAPKGGRLRYVSMTKRLESALRQHRHLRARRVLCQADGRPMTTKMIADHVRRAAKRTGLVNAGAHILRHTFCSHLAMHGAATRAIQELAGHQDIATTQRYMHLTPAALDAAIRLLDAPPVSPGRGAGGETATCG
jgi:integrase